MADAGKDPPKPAGIRIFVDADACPVKPEIYRVAERYGLKVYVVANAFMAVPDHDLIERVTVSEGQDAADDWIAQHAGASDIVVTADIPLAGRCIRNSATVIGPTGKPFTDDSIGMAIATRNLLTDLRSAGATTRGPPPLTRQDISRFLSALDLAVVRLTRKFAE
ncbi:MAG: YaiI/YqxD family protein [Pseudolabrys sp.]